MRTSLIVAAAVVFTLGSLVGWAAGTREKGYVLFVQLESELPYEKVVSTMEERSEAFRALPGLNQKYYLYDPAAKSFAGVYVFRSKADADKYLASELRKSLKDAYKVRGAPKAQSFELITALR